MKDEERVKKLSDDDLRLIMRNLNATYKPEDHDWFELVYSEMNYRGIVTYEHESKSNAPSA